MSETQRQALVLLRSLGSSAYLAVLRKTFGVRTWEALERTGYVRIVSDGLGNGPRVEESKS